MLGTMWWILAGCQAPPPEATSPEPTPPPPLSLDPGPPEAGLGYIPCDSEHDVSVVNADTVDHRVDAVRFRPLEGEVRFDAWDLELPVVVRAGRSIAIPLRDAGLEPGPTRGELTVTTDLGPYSLVVTGERTFGEARSETFVVPEPEVDVVLAVDQSGNMPGDYASDFAAGIGGYLDALSAVADWRLILVHAEDACNDGGLFEEGDRGAAGTIGDRAFSGPTHPYDERLLELASKALAENAPTECNGAFRRGEAQLHVVVVSDEPEQSGRDWSFWVNDFHDYADVVVVSGVVDAARRCNGGDAGYEQAIGQTGGASIDLCASGWEDRLPALADEVVPIPPVFPLDGDPVPESIEVRVDGRPVGATWDAARGAVVLDAPQPPGTEVEVTWSVTPVCDEG